MDLLAIRYAITPIVLLVSMIVFADHRHATGASDELRQVQATSRQVQAASSDRCKRRQATNDTEHRVHIRSLTVQQNP